MSWKWWRGQLRACLGCGSFLDVDESLFCPQCLSQTKRHQARSARQVFFPETAINCYYLFDWIQDESKRISLLVESLKGGGSPGAATYWATALWRHRWLLGIDAALPTVIVPAPPAQAEAHDHAYELAASLAKQTSSAFFCGLRRLRSGHQKEKNRQQRQQSAMSCVEKFTYAQGSRVAFVDDVLTTGATARAAWVALGQPPRFEVWCLAHRRRKVATERKFLL